MKEGRYNNGINDTSLTYEIYVQKRGGVVWQDTRRIRAKSRGF